MAYSCQRSLEVVQLPVPLWWLLLALVVPRYPFGFLHWSGFGWISVPGLDFQVGIGSLGVSNCDSSCALAPSCQIP